MDQPDNKGSIPGTDSSGARQLPQKRPFPNVKKENYGNGSYQVSEPSSVLLLLTPPMIPSATTSPYGKMNQDELQASKQSCSFQLQVFSTKLKLWKENDLRKEMKSSLEGTIKVLEKRSELSEKLRKGAEAVVGSQGKFKDRVEKHKKEEDHGTKIQLNILDSCSKGDLEEHMEPYDDMAYTVRTAFWKVLKAKRQLEEHMSSWNEEIKKFNDEESELEVKNENLKELNKYWSIVTFVLSKMDAESGSLDQGLLNLMEKLMNGPAGFDLSLDEADVISRLNIEQNMLFLDTELPEFSWENRERLWSVCDKEKHALDVLKANLDMIKTNELHNEICKAISEAIEILKEKLPLISNVQKSAQSVSEAEKMISEKEAELQIHQRKDQEHKDLAQADYERGDFMSHLATLKKQVEAATKVEEIDRVVKEREKDLCKKKEIKDEEIKKVDAIDERLKNGQAKLKQLEKDWEVIKSMARSLENQNDNKIDRRRKSNLLVKRLQNQDPQQLDPDERNLLSQFTSCNGAHEGEPTAKRERLEVKEEQGATKKRRSNRN
ncbi:unnamed protein product [Caenorhabditis nigoni]